MARVTQCTTCQQKDDLIKSLNSQLTVLKLIDEAKDEALDLVEKWNRQSMWRKVNDILCGKGPLK